LNSPLAWAKAIQTFQAPLISVTVINEFLLSEPFISFATLRSIGSKLIDSS